MESFTPSFFECFASLAVPPTFARPYRCWKCRTHFYHAGRDSGFNLWIQERGQVGVPKMGNEFALEMNRDEGEPRLPDSVTPPSFWVETSAAFPAEMEEYEPPSPEQIEMHFNGEEELVETVDYPALRPSPTRRSHRQRGKSSHSSRGRGMRRQTKITIGLAVGLLAIAALFLYLYFVVQRER